MKYRAIVRPSDGSGQSFMKVITAESVEDAKNQIEKNGDLELTSLYEYVEGSGEVLKRARRYFDALVEIKEQLFDAPIEVKSAFNTVISYFDKSDAVYFVISKPNEGVCFYKGGPGKVPEDETLRNNLLTMMKRQYKDYNVEGPYDKDTAKSVAEELAKNYGVKLHMNPVQAKSWLKRS